MSGIQDGFHITNPALISKSVETKIYSSVTGKLKYLVKIQTEIVNKRYLTVHSKPQVISSLGALPKKLRLS